MAIKTGIIFCTLLLGSLALPVPENDMSIFFITSDDGPEQRIVGGSVAAAGSHPWMAGFTSGGNLRSAHCGASIITARTLLTAAHCIQPALAVIGSMRVNVGTNQLSSGGQSLTLSRMLMHPQYNGNTIKNDIGMLYTQAAISFNNLVRAIPVAFDNVGGGVPARVAGWGRTSANAAPSQQLLEIQVPTLGGSQCVTDIFWAAISLNFIPPPVDPNIEICTFHAVGRGTCRGDSGSALVRISNNQQIGIVSWGFPCALGAPDVYVRVSAYQAWINQNTV